MVFHAGQIRVRGRSIKMFQVIVEELGKDYRIYTRPVDRLLEAILRKPRHRALSAVQGVSFNLLRGQSLGIIGDNGAGKSTLLKLLVGTVSPTAGRMEMSGRVTALLELGAGFHPEFSGRQNIFMNASLLGLSPGGDWRKGRGNYRVFRIGGIYRSTGEDLFVGDVCASWIRHRHECGPGHPDYRRGPGRGGHGLSAEMH